MTQTDLLQGHQTELGSIRPALACAKKKSEKKTLGAHKLKVQEHFANHTLVLIIVGHGKQSQATRQTMDTQKTSGRRSSSKFICCCRFCKAIGS